MFQNRVRLLGGFIVLAGAWGGIVPFAGPLFGYPMPPGGSLPAWQWSASHLELHLLPAIAVIIGGAGVVASRRHVAAVASAALALLGGAWFVLAPSVSTAWLTRGGGGAGTPPSTFMSVITPVGYHYGTGLLIAVLAASALGLLARARTEPAAPVTIPGVAASQPATGAGRDQFPA